MTPEDQGELMADSAILAYLVKELARAGHLPVLDDALNAFLEIPTIQDDSEYSRAFRRHIEFYREIVGANRSRGEVGHAV